MYDAFLIQRDLALLDQRGGTMVTMLLVVLDDWTERVHVVCLWRWRCFGSTVDGWVVAAVVFSVLSVQMEVMDGWMVRGRRAVV